MTLPRLKLRALPKYPSRIQGGDGITVTTANGVVTISFGTSVAITGGTIDNAVIGGITPVAGTFTTVSLLPTVSGAALTSRLPAATNFVQYIWKNQSGSQVGYMGLIGASAGFGARDATFELGTSNTTPITIRPNETEAVRFNSDGSATFSSTVAATTYNIAAIKVLDRSTDYTHFYDDEAHAGLTLGDTTDPLNFYRNTVHQFYSRGGVAPYVRIDSTGLGLIDTDDSHFLFLNPGSNLTANRTLTINTGDANVTLDANVLSKIAQIAIVATGVNFNSANTDTTFPIVLPTGFTRYVLNSVRISGASASLTTATCGVFTAAGGGGVAAVTGQAITVSTAAENTNNNTQAVVFATGNTQSYTATSIFFRVQTPQGSAATANVELVYVPVS